MLEKKIQLKAFSDVKEFVKAAEKCEYDVDVFYNRVVVDAKSILGVMSMGVSRPLRGTCDVVDQECVVRSGTGSCR